MLLQCCVPITSSLAYIFIIITHIKISETWERIEKTYPDTNQHPLHHLASIHINHPNLQFHRHARFILSDVLAENFRSGKPVGSITRLGRQDARGIGDEIIRGRGECLRFGLTLASQFTLSFEVAFLFHGADFVGAFFRFEGAGGEEGVVGFGVGTWVGLWVCVSVVVVYSIYYKSMDEP